MRKLLLCSLVLLVAAPGICEQRRIVLTHQSSVDSLGIGRFPLLVKAQSAYTSRDFERAVGFGERALQKLDSAKDPELFVFANTLLGSSYTKLRAFSQALERLNLALRISQNLHRHPYLIADCHYHLGVYYDMTGNKDETVKHHTTALKLRVDFFGNDNLKVAESYHGLGEVYTFIFFDYRKAIAFYEKGLRIREIILPPDAYELYVSYYSLSQAYRMLEDGDKALSYAFKALTIVNSKKEYASLLEKCYMLLGNIHAGRLDYQLALQYFEQGMRESILTAGDNNYNLILSYTSLGLAYGEMNDLHRAIRCFKRSLEIYDFHKSSNAGLLASNLLHLGRMFQKAGAYDSAKYFLKRNLSVRLESAGLKNKRTSDAYSYLAKFFQAFGQLDSAAQYIQKALIAGIDNFDDDNIHANPILRSIKSYEFFELFGDKASILLDYHEQNQDGRFLLTAINCFKISDALMELNRSAYHQEGAKLFFADHYHHIYENALHASYLLFQQTRDPRYYADAVAFMEKSKAILLAESLNKAEIFTRVGLPDSIRDLERNFNMALAAYRSQVEGAEADVQPRLQAQIFEIAQKQEKLLDTIRTKYPNYFQIRYQQISPLTEIQAYAAQHDATVVEYFWGDKKLFVLGISGEKIVFREIGGLDSLTENVRNYYECLRKIPAWKDNALSYRNFFVNGNRIYNKALRPVLDELRSEKIIIIRDGPLLMIPFESLPVSKAGLSSHDFSETDYLLRHRTISYAHSADLLLKTRPKNSRLPAKSSVLAFSFSRSAEGREISLRNEMNELPGAAREITAISQIFPGTYLLGEEATERKFKILAPQYDILHLAVHGKSDPEKQFSGSLFFKRTADDEEDGELHVYELYDLSLKARLAVLSACESGVGKIFRGEGVFNIARGFAYAGCPSTLMTLWPVPDNVSALIMGEFYRQLGDGEQIDESLRTAKLNYLGTADPQLAHPAFWAAYIPTGLMEPVVPSTFANNTFRMGLAVIATLTMLFLLGKRIQRRVRREGRSPIHRE